MQIKFIFLETWGCAANQNNSEIIKGKLIESGLQFTDNPDIADMLILNTCVVKEPTENSIKRRIQELSSLNKPIIVAGCMPQVRKKWLESQKNVFLLGISHIKEVTKLIRRIINNNYDNLEFLDSKKEVKLNCLKIRNNKLIGISQISEGCLGKCSYCQVKLVKGNLFSYPQEEIIENIKQDLASGCREIWLTSQDLASYGLERNDNKAFIKLLKKVLSINSKFKLRLGMMNPNHVLPVIDDLIEVYKDERVYKFLHIPVQSGSDKILKLMNRKYTAQDFISIVNQFKQHFPKGTLATDIITGYPGEGEPEFQETLELINKAQPDVMNITRFWPMKSTRAASLLQVDRKIASNRASEVQKLHLQISLENNKKYENQIINILVNEQEGTNCLARDENYRLVVIRSKDKSVGKTIKTKVTKAFPHYLFGEIAR